MARLKASAGEQNHRRGTEPRGRDRTSEPVRQRKASAADLARQSAQSESQRTGKGRQAAVSARWAIDRSTATTCNSTSRSSSVIALPRIAVSLFVEATLWPGRQDGGPMADGESETASANGHLR
jgi:hypothetical protein